MNWDQAKALAYRLNETENGCCLHITINDTNVEDGNIAFCRNEAAKNDHPECERLGAWLAALTEDERNRFVDEIWDVQYHG